MRRSVAAVPLVLVPALSLAQGGFSPDAWIWSAALAAWASAVAVTATSSPGAVRREWPWPAAALALLLWTLLSSIWSADRAQSFLETRRMLIYAAVVLALLLLARHGANVLAPATLVAAAAVIAYALTRYLLGARRADEFEAFDIHQPLGYANALGILAVVALLLSIGLVADAPTRAARCAAAAVAPLATATVVLAQSTGSILAAIVGLVVVVLLSTSPVRACVAVAVVAPGALAAAAIAQTSGLATDADPRLSGRVVAIVLVIAALASAFVAAAVRLPVRPGRPRSRRLLIAVLLVIVAAAAVGVASAGSTEPRASYYSVAWNDQIRGHPLLGTGAGTFGLYWAESGKQATQGGALDAHSLYIETLAELGPVGLILLLVFLAAPLRGLLSRRSAPYVPAAAAAYAAFLMHAGLDWDWEMPAVVVAALCAAGAVATAELDDDRALSARARAALFAVSAGLGAAAIAGTASDTERGTTKAPQSGAF
jgi:O-Antigen ligase